VSRMSIEDKLAVNKFVVDPEVHITINEDICRDCEDNPCLFTCPSGCYTLKQDHINFSHEGCLECGSCRVVCARGSVSWTLPRSGFGISYEYG